MKPTKVQKKLSLRKEVIVSLDQEEAKRARGGNREECPPPACTSGSGYYIYLTEYSCPPPTVQQESPHKLCIL